MAIIGPNAELRIDGKADHDVATISWEMSKEKTPKPAIGEDVVSTFTAPATVTYTFSATVRAKSDGSFAIDWENWCSGNTSKALVVSYGTSTWRLVNCVVDSVSVSHEAEGDGGLAKEISGKFAQLVTG